MAQNSKDLTQIFRRKKSMEFESSQIFILHVFNRVGFLEPWRKTSFVKSTKTKTQLWRIIKILNYRENSIKILESKYWIIKNVTTDILLMDLFLLFYFIVFFFVSEKAFPNSFFLLKEIVLSIENRYFSAVKRDRNKSENGKWNYFPVFSSNQPELKGFPHFCCKYQSFLL